MIFVAVLLAFVAWPSVRGLKRRLPTEEIRVSPMRRADGLFHVYTLPVGQGNAQVIQCPSGEVSIFDMGTCSSSDRGFWIAQNITDFLEGKFPLVTNIFITHDDRDHYSFLDEVFVSADNVTGLQSIYISRLLPNWDSSIQNWVANISATSKVKTFNGGNTCGSSGGPSCGSVILCPRDSRITTRVLSVNAGQQCRTRNKNTDSIVLEITNGSFKLQLNGDFEDCTPNDRANVSPQKKMADTYYGSPDRSLTVYMLSHHGADSKANKRIIRQAVAPKAVVASSDPWFSTRYRHPRCTIIEAFANGVRPLCKPGVTMTSDAFYCGQQHPNANLPLADKVQSTYTCGVTNAELRSGLTNTERRTITTNDYAIYSTRPDEANINLVELRTDGTRWGFVNRISSLIPRQTASRSRAPAADECVDED